MLLFNTLYWLLSDASLSLGADNEFSTSCGIDETLENVVLLDDLLVV